LEYNLSPVAKIVPQIERDCKLVFHWKDLEVHRNNPFNLVATIAAYSDGGEEYLKQINL